MNYISNLSYNIIIKKIKFYIGDNLKNKTINIKK